MLQTFEASLEPNGELRFADVTIPTGGERRRVLVTFLPIVDAIPAINAKPAPVKNGDWQSFVGALKDSPRFADEPLALQQKLRGEWN